MGSSKSFLVRYSTLIAILLISTATAQNGTTWNYWSMKAFGANLGTWLVLERWIKPTLFETYAPNAIDEWTFSEQAENPVQALEEHWSTWIVEEDIRQFANVGGNHLRIPVGYWAFIEPDEGEPYVRTGQKPHLERVLGYCNTYNIHAIIDLHGVPGSQNGEHHSGRTGEIEFYTDYNQQRALNTVEAVVVWMNGLNPTLKSRIAAIQPVNEPHVDDNIDVLKRFYTNAYNIINASPYKVPMMFHDGFQGLEAFSDFLPPPAYAVIDLHPYHAFPPQTNRDEIIAGICRKQTFGQNFHLPVFYGEWSLSSGVPNDNDWFRQMMDSQVYAYKYGGAGFTFWTLKNFAVKGPMCDSTEILTRQLYYNCFEGITWSFLTLINENVVNNRTFYDTINQQCTRIETTLSPTTNPITNPTTNQPTSPTTNADDNSAVQSRSSVFLLMVSLFVCMKMVMHKMH